MRFPWTHAKDYDALKEAEAQRKLSEQNVREVQPLLHALREIRQRNHVGELITDIIERKVEKEAQSHD